MTDNQIKTILTHDLRNSGVDDIQFFFEQNDTVASGIAFHVRGGTEGLFTISDVREQIPAISRQALSNNPLFHDN